ncbi:MAG: 1-deoxy-D-xylulose-5-phosphate reductoisomerase [Pseudomonadota bacterium]
MKKTISVFGATGSVGQQTVDLIARDLDGFTVHTLTAESNVASLAEAAIKVNAKRCVISNPSLKDDLFEALRGTGIAIESGPDALKAAAEEKIDISVQSIVGFAGVAPSLVAAQHCKTLALANKESLVCAGRMLKATCAASGCNLIPLDSEHSAIFQCLKAGPESVKKIILTASGGPFVDYTAEELSKVTVVDASKHPNWDMGQRITIDSASMFNKAMEMVEAQMLFDLSPDQIEVVVHPQSVLHSAVVMEDDAIIAHLGAPDMRMPIGYALYYPMRRNISGAVFSLTDMAQLSFKKPNTDLFPSLKLAERAMQIGGAAGLVLNAAKEMGLDQFIDGKIEFLDMARGVAHSLEVYANSSANMPDTLDGLNAMNEHYRQTTKTFFESER